MLIAPNAPLVFERGLKATYMRHAYDFYKPDLSSEYPTVDGKLSIECYLSALDNCYRLYGKKFAKNYDNQQSTIDLNIFDAFLFHTPYCKLVQKSLARLVLNDYINDRDNPKFEALRRDLKKDVTLEGSYFDKDLERTFLTFSKDVFEEKTQRSLLIARQVGNMYTPSLYGGLVSLLITHDVERLIGKRVGLFSYGSGLASSMFSIKIVDEEREKLLRLTSKLNEVYSLLEKRIKIAPKTFDETLELRERVCHAAPYKPTGDVKHFFPGTYYLTDIDEMHRRKYERTSNIQTSSNGFA